MSEQHEWTPGKTFYLSCGICGVDSKFHKESNKWLSGEALQDYDKVIHVGGHRSGKSKLAEEFKLKMELLTEMKEKLENSVSYSWHDDMTLDLNTGIITCVNEEHGKVTQFRLVEVKE